ncbi:hypothetical protein LCGC14_1265770 [marine sediment metagenome]|uniref:Uncharacterized protein n=1 Tax=marine sediment metagenome TaxID=412755 RepID=A0A0F9L1M9_9ZZZZ
MSDEINCPYCHIVIDPINIMGDSDWDEQEFDWYDDVECPNCNKRFKIRQFDVEITRSFEIEKYE